MPKTDCSKSLSLMTPDEMEKACGFQRSFPRYSRTLLVSLSHLAGLFGVKGIYIKDESFRFDLNVFTVFCGSYAITKYIAKRLGKNISENNYEILISAETKCKLDDITFSCH